MPLTAMEAARCYRAPHPKRSSKAHQPREVKNPPAKSSSSVLVTPAESLSPPLFRASSLQLVACSFCKQLHDCSHIFCCKKGNRKSPRNGPFPSIETQHTQAGIFSPQPTNAPPLALTLEIRGCFLSRPQPGTISFLWLSSSLVLKRGDQGELLDEEEQKHVLRGDFKHETRRSTGLGGCTVAF